MWNNSLGIEGLYLNNLYNDISDGVSLLKTLDKVKPGCIDWKKVTKNPTNKFQKLGNCNLAVNVSR
jgi:plastin-1